MNVELLIHAIVRQTVVLIAQLATHGTRAPLADMAEQVFVMLVNELRGQGLSHRMVANMFALPLSTYHDRIRRSGQSQTKQGSLWQEVLSYVEEKQPVTQNKILYEFHRDSAEDVLGVLNDLVKARLASKTGYGLDTTYEITSERSRMQGSHDPMQAAATFLWVAIYSQSPVRLDELQKLAPMDEAVRGQALEILVRDGRVMREEDGAGEVVYLCDSCVLPFGASIGWEAAVFDHYQAMVKAICAKLRQGDKHALPKHVIGGSTYKFYVNEGHPMRDEVLAMLQQSRERAGELRERVSRHNQDHGLNADEMDEVLYYVGQTVLAQREGEPSS